MRCPECSEDNREGRRYCAQCGHSLPLPCAYCRFLNRYGEKFCGGCGKTLSTGLAQGAHAASDEDTDPPHSGHTSAPPERRQLTIMFCDLVGSTSLSDRLDPEDWREVLRAYQAASTSFIARFEGYVSRYLGDGILALFGYPQAHEDDAERAVRAGLGIVDAIAALDTRFGKEKSVQLGVRVGIATGLVVAGDLIGEQAAEEQAVVGKTPNLAARLQGLADPNSVVIGADTYNLISELFEYEDLGEHELKGLLKPQHVRKVLRPREASSRFDLSHGGALTSPIGRENEIQTLKGCWEQAKQGRGQVVLVSGEAGIGKSRVILAIREHIANEPHVRLRLQCSPYHTHSELYPFITQLARAANIQHENTPQQRLNKLESMLRRASERVEDVAPLFATLLSIPSDDHQGLLELNPEQLKQRTFTAFIEQLEGLSAKQHVLVVLEDIHWIDPTSLELLSAVIGSVRHCRVLFLMSFRPDFHPPWQDQSHMTVIELPRMDRDQSLALIEQVTQGKRLPADVQRQIVLKTDGVPLFIEELTKTVLDSGLLREVEGHYHLIAESLPPFAIPTTLQDSLMARLDRLSTVKEVAQLGAVIGREFPYRLLVQLADLPETRLQSALARLVDADLVFVRGKPPNAEYSFRHALVQEAAYQSLLKSRRQQFHARLAGLLATQISEQHDISPELVAHHYAEAGLIEKALLYWEQAGRLALSRAANLEVIGHVTKALEALSTLSKDGQLDNKKAHMELSFQMLFGAAYRATKGFASVEAEQSFVRAQTLSRQLGGGPHDIDILRGLYACYYIRGELKIAREQAEQVLELGQHSEGSGILMVGHWMLGCIQFWQGEFVGARDGLKTAVSLYKPAEQQTKMLSTQIDPGLSALIHLGWVLWVVGYPEQAREAGEEAIAQARELCQPYALAMALFWAGSTYTCCGQFSVAAQHLKELSNLTEEHDLAYLGACANILDGQIEIAKQQYAEGLGLIEKAFSAFGTQGAGLGRPWAVSMPVAALAKIGKVDKGQAMLEGGFKAVQEKGERQWEAELYRLKGELLLATAEPDLCAAADCFGQAIDISRAQGAKSLQLRATMGLVQLMRRQDQVDKALQDLTDLYGWFSEGLDTMDLKAAKVLMDELR